VSTARLLEVDRRTLSMPAAPECYSELLIEWRRAVLVALEGRECVLTTVDCTPLRGRGGRMLICRRNGGAMKQVRAQREVTVVCAYACADRLEAIVFAVRRWRLVMRVFRLRTKYSVCRSFVRMYYS